MYVKQETLTVYVIYDGYEFVHSLKKECPSKRHFHNVFPLSGSLEGVMKVMKEPLTLDDPSLGPESETREEMTWKLQSYEEQIKQLSEENKVTV